VGFPFFPFAEEFGLQLETVSSSCQVLLFIVNKLFFSSLDSVINSTLDLLSDVLLEFGISSRVQSQLVNFALSVRSKSIVLAFFPSRNESLKSVENKSLFIVGQLAILSHSVKTDYVFNFSALRNGLSNFVPFLFFLVKRLVVCFCGLTAGSYFSLVGFNFLMVFLHSLVVGLSILNKSLKTLIRKATVVD